MQDNQTKQPLDLLPYISKAELSTAIAKSGNSYNRIVITFTNGYSKMLLLNREAEFLIRDLATKQKPNIGENIPVSIN